ncbi:acrosin-binding protein-like protein [Turdus rufiventris]|nr:acrosin-binding protein-like protein [Turdus rufiventris]
MMALWAYLALFGPWGTKAQQPGTPLSDQEYLQFFEFLRITIQANTVCHLREMYGCKNSLVQRLDEYENHGVIPPGPICSELPENTSFHNFCTFSLYRCITKQYFLKRTACPEHSRANQHRQTGTDIIMSSDDTSPSSFGPQPVMSPTAGSEPSTEAVVIPTSPTADYDYEPSTEAVVIPTSPTDDYEPSTEAVVIPTSPTADYEPSTEAVVIPTSPTADYEPSTETGVIPTSLPVSTQPNPSSPEATEVTASDQQQGHLPNSDIEDLLLRILDNQVQTSLQTMKLLMSLGKTVKEEELRRAATSLLLALNNANVSRLPTN